MSLTRKAYNIVYLDGKTEPKFLTSEERTLIMRNKTKLVYTCLPVKENVVSTVIGSKKALTTYYNNRKERLS